MTSFLRAYIEAALFTCNDESTPQGGEPLDKNYGAKDLAPETLAKMTADCEAFQAANGELLTDENLLNGRTTVDQRAGHDFWLTRNGHGAGFWDGDWEETAGKLLTAASKKFGECHLYVGDDKKLYLM